MQNRARLSRRWGTGVLVLACAAAVVAAVLAVGPSGASPAAGERIVTAARGVVQATVSGSGTIAAARQLDVNFENAGKLVHVYVKPGQRVVEGQLLAEIDPHDAQVKLDAAEASLAAAEAGGSGSGGGATASTASAADATPASGGSSAGSAASKAASVASAQAAVDAAQATLDATKLRAPIGGTVASVAAQAGEQVAGGGTTAASSSAASAGGSGGSGSGSGSGAGASSDSAFVVIADLDALHLVVPFSESDVGKLKVGKPATVTVNALPDEQLAARVVSIATLATSNSGVVSYAVTLRLDQHARGLKVGMTATAKVVVEQVGNAVNVASAAISGRGAGASVTLARGKQRVRQTVTTGIVGDSTTQVLSGLKSGDRVVVATAAPGAGGSGINAPGGAGAGARGRLGGLGGGGGGPVFVGPAGGGGPP